MRTTRLRRRLAVMTALLVGAVFLIACERTAELIPGEATPTPTATEGTAGTAAPTPIVVNPGTGGPDGVATGGQVIADHDLALSVVQVLVADNSAGFEEITRYGTGVVVDAEQGLIATAYPVVDPYRADGSPAYSSLIIAADRVPGTAPQREFLAEVVAADPAADLAVLRVVSDLEGQPLAASGFDLPAVVMGDASTAGTGYSLRLFGYPGGGAGESATQVVEMAHATIEGQRGAVGRTGRTWFKIDSRMPFGAAGGPAFDRFGALIGILAQDRYLPAGVIGQVRPLDLLTPLLAEASEGGAYDAPLYRDAVLPGSLQAPPASPAYVSRPAFAENAIETGDSRDLFDYETRFAEGLGSLYYEYEVNGVAEGATIEERWFLDDVQQESLSSSYVWSQGGFGYINDRITAPSTAGIPNGRWRLDVYVDNVLHATATAIVGTSLPAPAATFQFGAATATPQGDISVAAFNGASQLLVMFDLTGMTGANEVEWHVFRDNQPVFTSTAVPWSFGEAGRFWVGYAPEGGISPGTWEVELHADGTILDVGTVTLF